MHVENHQLYQKEVLQLVKDFTTEHAHAEVKFYLSMMKEGQQNFEGLMQHLTYAFKYWETDSSLITAFFSQSNKAKETEEAFTENLQVLVLKIILWKSSIMAEANNALKQQNTHS